MRSTRTVPPPMRQRFVLTALAARQGRSRRPCEDALGRLSPREREVLCLLARRYSDREIAEALFISYRTVTTHVTNILNKLGVDSRRAAAAAYVPRDES